MRDPEEILPTGKEFREYLERERIRFARVAGPHLLSEEEQYERLSYYGKEITDGGSLKSNGASLLVVQTGSIENYR
jgi:hypothetical protein